MCLFRTSKINMSSCIISDNKNAHKSQKHKVKGQVWIGLDVISSKMDEIEQYNRQKRCA